MIKKKKEKFQFGNPKGFINASDEYFVKLENVNICFVIVLQEYKYVSFTTL